jgi:hypothetical protein
MGKLRNLRLAAVATGVVAALSIWVAQALAAGDVARIASGQAKPPYLLMTIAHGKVTKVRWDVYYTCYGAYPLGYQTGAIVLNAPIRSGRFSKSVTYSIGSSSVGGDFATTTVSGTVAGHTAAVRLRDDQSLSSYGECLGNHKFTLRKTPTGWVSVAPQPGKR